MVRVFNQLGDLKEKKMVRDKDFKFVFLFVNLFPFTEKRFLFRLISQTSVSGSVSIIYMSLQEFYLYIGITSLCLYNNT